MHFPVKNPVVANGAARPRSRSLSRSLPFSLFSSPYPSGRVGRPHYSEGGAPPVRHHRPPLNVSIPTNISYDTPNGRYRASDSDSSSSFIFFFISPVGLMDSCRWFGLSMTICNNYLGRAGVVISGSST